MAPTLLLSLSLSHKDIAGCALTFPLAFNKVFYALPGFRLSSYEGMRSRHLFHNSPNDVFQTTVVVRTQLKVYEDTANKVPCVPQGLG